MAPPQASPPVSLPLLLRLAAAAGAATASPNATNLTAADDAYLASVGAPALFDELREAILSERPGDAHGALHVASGKLLSLRADAAPPPRVGGGGNEGIWSKHWMAKTLRTTQEWPVWFEGAPGPWVLYANVTENALPISDHCMAVLGDTLFTYGGKKSDERPAGAQLLAVNMDASPAEIANGGDDKLGGVWAVVPVAPGSPSPPAIRSKCQMGVDQQRGELLLFGGKDIIEDENEEPLHSDDEMSDFWAMEPTPDGAKWRRLESWASLTAAGELGKRAATPGPEQNTDNVMIVVGRHIVFAGGSPDAVGAWFVYNLDDERWESTGSDPRLSIEDPAGAKFGDCCAVVIGGSAQFWEDEPQPMLLLNLTRPLAEWAWEVMPGMAPQGEDIHAAPGPGGTISVIADADSDSPLASNMGIAVYDGKEWTEVRQAPGQWAPMSERFRITTVQGKMVFFGGRNRVGWDPESDDDPPDYGELWVFDSNRCPYHGCNEGRGTCMLGNCVNCADGWRGPFCEEAIPPPPAPIESKSGVPKWVIPVAAVAGVLLLGGLAVASWKLSAQKRKYWALHNNTRIAEETAVAIAGMDLDSCAYLLDIPKPNKIQQAFMNIIAVLTEYRAFLPQSTLAVEHSGLTDDDGEFDAVAHKAGDASVDNSSRSPRSAPASRHSGQTRQTAHTGQSHRTNATRGQRNAAAVAAKQAQLTVALVKRSNAVCAVGNMRDWKAFVRSEGQKQRVINYHAEWLDRVCTATRGTRGIVERFVADEVHACWNGMTPLAGAARQCTKALCALNHSRAKKDADTLNRCATDVSSREQSKPAAGAELHAPGKDATPATGTLSDSGSSLPQCFYGAALGRALCGNMGCKSMRGGAVLGRVVDVARACHAVAKQASWASVVDRRISQEAQHEAVMRQVDCIRLPPCKSGEGASAHELYGLIRLRAGEGPEGKEEWMYDLQKKEAAQGDLYTVAWEHLHAGRIAEGARALRQYEAAAREAADAPLAGRLAHRVEAYRDAGGQEGHPIVHGIAWYAVRPYVKGAPAGVATPPMSASAVPLPPAMSAGTDSVPPATTPDRPPPPPPETTTA